MMTFRISAAIIVLLCGGSSALSQVAKDPTKPSPRLVAYEQFFTRIAEIRKPSVQPRLTARAAGDKTVVLQPPDLSRILGLSNTEVAKLSQVASDCDRDIRLFYGDAEAWMFEARLQMLESAQLSRGMAERVEMFEKQHEEIIRGAIEKLKGAISENSLAGLDSLVNSTSTIRSLLVYRVL